MTLERGLYYYAGRSWSTCKLHEQPWPSDNSYKSDTSHTPGICSATAAGICFAEISPFLHLTPISGLPVAWTTPAQCRDSEPDGCHLRQPQVWIFSLCFGVWRRVEKASLGRKQREIWGTYTFRRKRRVICLVFFLWQYLAFSSVQSLRSSFKLSLFPFLFLFVCFRFLNKKILSIRLASFRISYLPEKTEERAIETPLHAVSD